MDTPTPAFSDAAPRPVGLEAAREELGRVLASTGFADAGRLRSLLAFLVEETILGHAGGIKESVIAVEVFGRTAGYDSRSDSVVRVQARNLRRKLEEYYSGQGCLDPVRIDLPKGSYVPVFQYVEREPGSTAPVVGTGRSKARILILTGIAGAALLGLALWWWFGRPERPGRRPPTSIAVLPFVNMTGNPENEYIADGVVEDVTALLSRIPGLRVTARTSAFAFRGQSVDVREIGRRLAADSVIEGSLRMEGKLLVITAQLVSSADGYHLWSGTYRGDRTAVASIEDEIGRGVAGALRLTARPAAAVYVPGEAARELYWRARHLRSDPDRRPEAIRYLEQAVALEPGYVEAWSRLATATATMAMHRQGGQLRETAAKAKEMARRTLGLDETNALAHAALGVLVSWCDWNWPEAEKEFRRAIALDPGAPLPRLYYAWGLVAHGRFAEALQETDRAMALDPLDFRIIEDRTQILYYSRRFGEAAHEAESVLKANPALAPARLSLAASLSADGRHAESLAAFRELLPRRRSSEELGRYGAALAAAGRREEAQAVLRELEAGPGGAPAEQTHMAYLRAALGDRAGALDCLERACAAREENVLLIAVEPVFDSLRSDPRFAALQLKMGL